MSNETIQKLKGWLEQKELECPVCKSSGLMVNDAPLELLSPGAGPGFRRNPFLQVTCRLCGHVLLFDQDFLAVHKD